MLWIDSKTGEDVAPPPATVEAKYAAIEAFCAQKSLNAYRAWQTRKKPRKTDRFVPPDVCLEGTALLYELTKIMVTRCPEAFLAWEERAANWLYLNKVLAR